MSDETKPTADDGRKAQAEGAETTVAADGAASAAANDGAEAANVDAGVAGEREADFTPPKGAVTILAPQADRRWDDRIGAAPPRDEQPKTSGLKPGLMAAAAAIALVCGALGGAMATSFVRPAAEAQPTKTVETAIGRLEADVAALKSSLEQSTQLTTAQLNKIGDRFEKVEKAQAEPAAKLARLSEAVEKLRTASAAAPAAQPVAVASAAPVAPAAVAAAPAPARETTASTPALQPESKVGRLPTVEGWVLRDVANGYALIEGRRGIYEVYAGDPVPGLGRVDAIRRQDGRWVVVTTRGLIVAR